MGDSLFRRWFYHRVVTGENAIPRLSPDPSQVCQDSYMILEVSPLRSSRSASQRRIPRWLILVVFALLGTAPGICAQGVSTRNAPPASRASASGKPFLAKFTDIAAQNGLSMRFASG